MRALSAHACRCIPKGMHYNMSAPSSCAGVCTEGSPSAQATRFDLLHSIASTAWGSTPAWLLHALDRACPC